MPKDSLSDRNQARIRSVIVDDNAIFLKSILRILEEDQQIYVVGTATNAADGLKQIRETRPDIAIIDLRLPDVNGLELIATLRSEMPSLPTVAMSFHVDDVLTRAAVQRGASQFIPKDKLAQELIPLIHELCESVQANKQSLDTTKETDMGANQQPQQDQMKANTIEQLDLANQVLENAKQNVEEAQNVLQDTKEALQQQPNEQKPEQDEQKKS